MKKVLTALLIVSLLSSCLRESKPDNRVSQSITSDVLFTSPNVHNSNAVATFVWYEGEIVESWFDEVSTITDSILTLRKKQGDSVLTKLTSVQESINHVKK